MRSPIAAGDHMLLPDKHIALSESLLGLGSLLLELVSTQMTIDEIYIEYGKRHRAGDYPAYHSYENVVLALDFLFAVGAITQDKLGRISRCD